MSKIETIQQRHSHMVNQLVKSGNIIKESLTPHKCDVFHAVLGIVTEAGELADIVKKHIIYEQQLDVPNIEEELGDLEFYMEQLRQAVNISREQCLESNMHKLAKRYVNYDYSNARAAERADKK